MPVKRSNPKIYDTIKVRCDELANKEASVGWLGGHNYENGTPVAYVASINEFGKNKRPFFRPTIAQRGKAWAETMKRGAKAILLHGESPTTVLEQVAMQAEGDVAATIASITSPPLSPITILLRYWRRLGRKITGKTVGEAAAEVKKPGYQNPDVQDKPLNDSGIMFDTLTHEVRDKS